MRRTSSDDRFEGPQSLKLNVGDELRARPLIYGSKGVDVARLGQLRCWYGHGGRGLAAGAGLPTTEILPNTRDIVGDSGRLSLPLLRTFL